MIKSIRLKNWRSHKDSTINFSKGTNIIVGRMGGGKSSIIDGICFALFGTTPAVQHRRLKITDLIKNRPKEESEAEVTLVFQHKNDEYRIIRRVKKKGGSEAEIYKNNTRVEGPQSERVSEYIHHLLEIDYELFTRAIYSEQNRIDYFLTLGRGERKRQIDELIGIDKFETARKNATTMISRLKTMKSDKEIFIKNANIETIKKEINEMEKEISSIKEEKKLIEKEVEEISKQKIEKEEKVNELRKMREAFRKLQDEIVGLKHNSQMLIKDIESTKLEKNKEEMEREVNEKKNLKEEIEKKAKIIDVEYREITKQAAFIKSEIENLERKNKMKIELQAKLNEALAGENLENLKQTYNNNEDEIKELIKQNSENKAKTNEIIKSINELSQAGSHCPVCDSELNDEHKADLINKKEKTKVELESKIKETEEKVKKLETQNKNLKMKIENSERITSLLKEYEGIEEKEKSEKEKFVIIEKKMEEIVKNKKELESQLKEITNQYIEVTKLYEKVLELENKKRKLENVKKELIEKESEISKISFNENLWEQENKQLNEINVKYAEKKSKRDQIEEKEKYITKIIDEKRERVKEAEQYSKEIEIYNKLISNIQIFSTAVIETQQELREELIDSINEALSTIWEKIYPYSDYEVLKLIPSENDYDLMFKVNDYYISVDGVASGGERALACLALRVAFAMVLTPNLSWLILDEPTHNLDEEAVRTLAETLREHIPQIVEQTFVITHDELMKEAASGKLVRIYRDPENTETSKVEELEEITVSTPQMQT